MDAHTLREQAREQSLKGNYTTAERLWDAAARMSAPAKHTFGSVCSGIEAASNAWHPLGWRAVWLAEIEPFPSAVLAHHFPAVPNLGDMRAIAARVRAGDIAAPDVLTGGTPCQAFSVAGLRRGLDDARGQLTLSFVDLANAIDEQRAQHGQQPAVIVWENVPGVLSSKDNAFGCFLGALAGEDLPLEPPGGRWADAGFVCGPQRRVAWRVLDAQHFGVAQRRKRVWLVASAGALDPAEILFEPARLPGHPAQGGEPRQEVAGTLASRTSAGGFPGTDEACSGYLQAVAVGGSLAHTLTAEGHDASEDGTGRGTPVVASPTYCVRTANTGANGHGVADDCAHTLDTTASHAVAYPLDLRNACRDADKHDAMNRQGLGVGEAGDPSHTLTSAFVHGVAVAGSLGGFHPNAAVGGENEPAPTLPAAAGMGGGHTPCVAYSLASKQQSLATGEDLAATLGANDHKEPQAVAFKPGASAQARSIGAGPLCPTLEAGGGGNNKPAVAFAAGFKAGQSARGGIGFEWEQAQTLQAQMSALEPTALVPETAGYIVRKLTPRECERLQGFPDDYTLIPWKGKPASECPDGPRYKALGNSWAVPCAAWVGARIDRAMAA